MQNSTGYGWEGSAYTKTKDLKTSDIAKLIKQELIKKFPNFKFSVKTQVYSGGSSVNCYITELPYNPLNPEYNQMIYGSKRYIDRYIEDTNKIQAIGNKYRFNDSDAMIDYFSTNFYFFVQMDWETEKRFYDMAKIEL